MAYTIALVIIALVLGNPGIYVFGGTIAVAIITVYYLENHLIIAVEQGSIHEINLMFAIVCLSILVALSRLANRQIGSSYKLAQSYSDEFNTINVTLEQKVAERTLEMAYPGRRPHLLFLEKKV